MAAAACASISLGSGPGRIGFGLRLARSARAWSDWALFLLPGGIVGLRLGVVPAHRPRLTFVLQALLFDLLHGDGARIFRGLYRFAGDRDQRLLSITFLLVASSSTWFINRTAC